MTIFLSDFTNNPQVLIPVVAVGMSLMIPIVAIIVDHFQKKAKMRLVEKAIEHGADISSLDLDFECESRPPMPYRSGTITLAVGLALVVGARYAPQIVDVLGFFATIGGAICIFVGIGLLINDRVNRDRFNQRRDTRTSGPVDIQR